MKIAVFHNLPKGGAKRVMKEQVKLLREKHQVDIFTIKEKAPERKRQADVFKFWHLKLIHQKLAKKIDQKDYDVILVHPSKFTQAPYLLRYLQTRTVYYAHEVLRLVYEEHFKLLKELGFIKNFYEKISRAKLKKEDFVNLKAAGEILVNSYHTQETIFKAYGRQAHVCYPGVDSNHFRPLRIKKKREILFVGQPSKVNGFDFLNEAVRLIKPKPDVRVVKGNLTEKDLITAYNQAMLTACTALVEPFGLVALESMACATPVVAVKEGGYRETIIDGQTGFLVDREAKILAEKMRLLLKTPGLVKEMGRQGRKYVKKEWSWKKNIIKLEKILENT